MPKKSLPKPKDRKAAVSGKKILAGATLTGSLLLTSGADKVTSLNEKPPELRLAYGLVSNRELKTLLKKLLETSVPNASRVLTEEEEVKLSENITQVLGIKAVSELNSNRLNHQVGFIGLEQHLKRYPNDNLQGREFPQAGLAPGKGAWGYFASSKATLASNQVKMEKYYLAVQTMYLPDWKQRVGELYQWYKYRKMLVINPETGAAVVAVIADAGPAKWTGKQFGGSPSLMHDLGLYPNQTRGKVIVLFVDDPEEKVPLGPVSVTQKPLI